MAHPSPPLVWVVGDAMADVTVRSERFRRTPEDPTVFAFPAPHPDRPGVHLVPGGAANVAANLRAMGCDVRLLAVTCEAGFGAMLHANLRAADIRLLTVLPGGKSALGVTTKVRFVEGGKLVGRVDYDFDAPGAIPPPLYEPTHPPAAVVLCDHGRGTITADSVRAWTRWAHSRGIPVYADPKDGRQHVFDGAPVDVMVANHAEACGSRAGVRDIDISDDAWAKTLASSCRAAWGPFKVMVVKRSQYGSVWATKGDNGPETGLIPAVDPQQVFDVCGAGDTYLAGLVTARCRGANIPDACFYASAAAGVAVGRPGTAIVSAADTAAAIAYAVAGPHGVMTRDQAVVLAEQFRDLGLQVVLNCGCYQVLHPGHTSSLQAASELGDFLFVAVDSDTKVAALKGPGNPVVGAVDRVAVVAAVMGVGAAFVFDEPLGELVKAMRPAVLAKGGEYKVADIDGAAYVESYGGKVELLPMVEVEHNRDLIARIRKG